jgi:prepilin peptidase CpaA
LIAVHAVFLATMLLGATLAVSVFTDVYRGKVYNIVTVPAIVAGLTGAAVMHGWHGFLGGMGGLLLGGALLFLPFAFHVLGAGDVKLSAAVGAIGGPWFVFQTVMAAFLFAAVATVVIRLCQGRLVQTVKRSAFFFLGLFLPRYRPDMSQVSQGQCIPFALCLAFGAMAVKFMGF